MSSVISNAEVVLPDTHNDVSSDNVLVETEYLFQQNFAKLRSECYANDILFEDPEFPVDSKHLRERSSRYIDDVEWMRPHEIIRPQIPILVSDRNEGFYIRQGLDAWFAPAMSAVAESESLLRKIVPMGQGFSKEEQYSGIFYFRLWFGHWMQITIDDRLPVRNGSLIYMRSMSNQEFWPALLEKAYAKAKGSYATLDRWPPIDACVELTGGIPEHVSNLFNMVATTDENSLKQANRLFFDLLRASQNGNIIVCRCPVKSQRNSLRLCEAEQLGLDIKQAYRVVHLANLGNNQRIIHVRNCSSSRIIKWTGAWNYDDTRWANVPLATKKQLDAFEDAFQDGGFWMAYGDFLKYFESLDVCHISTDVDQAVTFHGRWEDGLNAGGVLKADFRNYAKNPQCFIRLNDANPFDVMERNATAVISLLQKRLPGSHVKGINKIGFKVFRVSSEMDELSSEFFSFRRNDGGHRCVAKTPTWIDAREVNMRVRLPVGKYCIIPSTFEPHKEGDFVIRVHIERNPRTEDDDGSSSLGEVVDEIDEII